ncbi:MAG: S-adenosyl-l-methionine hydroxide adenosyltransferase family protein [Candidatus Hadarchaeia archaeon]
MPPIALITDFGNRDYYVGSMKGVILAINPEAKLVDITHEISKQDVRRGAFVLSHAAKTFPPKSVFVGVIDPGVGTGRRCILLRTGNGLTFIGPDNGLFTLVERNYEIEEMRKIENPDMTRTGLSTTFHGRDILAPVGAHITAGISPSKVGPEIKEIKRIDIEDAELKNNKIEGNVLNIDDFGNLVTNIPREMITKITSEGENLRIKINRRDLVLPFVKTFGDVPVGENLAYIGSSNFVELAKNQGNFSEEINLDPKNGINIRITPPD